MNSAAVVGQQSGSGNVSAQDVQVYILEGWVVLCETMGPLMRKLYANKENTAS